MILLLVVDVTPWVELLFPLWILFLSVDTLVESFRDTKPREPGEPRGC